MRKIPLSSDKRGTKSVSKSVAPIETMLQFPEDLKNEFRSLSKSFEAMKAKETRLFYLASFLLETGCRISEALRIDNSQIDWLGRVKIKAGKGSRDRVASSMSSSSFLVDEKKKGGRVWQDYSRFYVYRRFKYYGIGRVFGSNKKQSVTHSFRHFSVLFFMEIYRDDADLALITGHKSYKSLETYKKK